jgi:hypothetical protein
MAPLALVIAVSLLDVAGLVNKAVTPLPLFAMVFFALLYTLFFFRRTHRQVILYEDGIEVSAWFSVRELKRSEILGRRMGKLAWQAGGGSFYIMVPTDKAARELRLPSFLHMDKDFFSWMEGIPSIKE